MKLDPKTLATISLIGFVAVTGITLAVKETRYNRSVTAAEAGRAKNAPLLAKQASTILVTYYHTTARCPSCLKIESLTYLTVTNRLAVPLADKRLVWRTVNLDEPENVHFGKDYSLHTKSVIVSEVKAGREIRWKNLDKVWPLLGDQPAFEEYVEKEVRAFLEPA